MARKGRGKRTLPLDSPRHNNHNFNRTATRAASVSFPTRDQSTSRSNRNRKSLSAFLTQGSWTNGTATPPKRPHNRLPFTSHHDNLDSDGDQVMHRPDKIKKRMTPTYQQPRLNSSSAIAAIPRTPESTNAQIAGVYKTTLDALRTPRQALTLTLPPCHHCADIAGKTSRLRAVMASLSTAQHQALDMWETGMVESVQCCEQARVVALAHVECLVRGVCACELGFDAEAMDWQPEPVIPVHLSNECARDQVLFQC